MPDRDHDDGDKRRLDEAVAERGLAASRAKARDLILRGLVRVDGRVAAKPAQMVGAAARIEADQHAAHWVSRGAEKLAAGLDAFAFDCSGRTALDVGASTGGFTQVLLERGASRVYAVDVGRGQLAPAIATDARVSVFDGQDARALNRQIVPDPISAIVADVSFISLTKALPAALDLAVPGAFLVALIKPQFEAGPEAVGKGGIVRDAAVRLAVVQSIEAWLARRPGWQVLGVVASPLPGGDGNVEFLIGAVRNE